MNAWLTAMDIPVGGKTYQIVREQSRRISRCRLTFFRRTSTAELVTNGAFVRDAILPLDPSEAGQMPLWQERVRTRRGLLSIADRASPSVARNRDPTDIEPFDGDRSIRLACLPPSRATRAGGSRLGSIAASIWGKLRRTAIFPPRCAALAEAGARCLSRGEDRHRREGRPDALSITTARSREGGRRSVTSLGLCSRCAHTPAGRGTKSGLFKMVTRVTAVRTLILSRCADRR